MPTGAAPIMGCLGGICTAEGRSFIRASGESFWVAQFLKQSLRFFSLQFSSDIEELKKLILKWTGGMSPYGAVLYHQGYQ